MNIIVSDITGRTLNYDYALCEAISARLSTKDKIEFWGPKRNHSENLMVRSFGSIVPGRYKTSTSIMVRILKAFDAIFAYILICFWVLKIKPDVFHLQWFPFLSLGIRGASVDLFFIKMLKKCSRHTHLVFTIHNMCPHGMPEENRKGYNPIFSNALRLFDHFVVHTERTKDEVVEVFGLNRNQVTIVYHGVFKPQNVEFKRREWNDKIIKFIMYGSQNWYKGTDIFVEALSLLPVDIKNRIKISICGVVDQEISDKCKAIDTGCDIEWMSYFLDDNLLYEKIKESDIILLPYRRISQSGVLLLAIATKRLIITSDLPTFKETLKGYDDEMFFESENSQSLADIICKYINGVLNVAKALNTLESLEVLYSWDKSAMKTMQIYNSL